MSDQTMTPEQRARIEAARASIAALRDTAREYGAMPFKVRDMHVSLLHRQLDELEKSLAAHDALQAQVAALTADLGVKERAGQFQAEELRRAGQQVTALESAHAARTAELDKWQQSATQWQARAETLALEKYAAETALAEERARVGVLEGAWWRWCGAVKEFVEADVNSGLSNEALKAANDRAERLYREWEQDRDNAVLLTLRRENLDDCLRVADVNSQAQRRFREARKTLDLVLTDAALAAPPRADACPVGQAGACATGAEGGAA